MEAPLLHVMLGILLPIQDVPHTVRPSAECVSKNGIDSHLLLVGDATPPQGVWKYLNIII